MLSHKSKSSRDIGAGKRGNEGIITSGYEVSCKEDKYSF